MTNDEKVSLVMTVLNEADGIAEFARSLLGQTRLPDEVVIVDGGSSDGTPEVLQRELGSLSLRVISAPDAGIAAGRNIAIEAAANRILAVTDAGTDLHPQWLERLVAPFAADPEVGVVAGFFLPGGVTWFERALASVITPQRWEIDPDRFLPSSRSVAFTRDAWSAAGGYPEWLSHCEDLVFDMDMRDAGYRFAFAPDALVSWRARPNLRAFGRQYFLYARGDGHAGLFPRRHAIRYAAYATGLALCIAVTRGERRALLPLLAGAVCYLNTFHRRVARSPVGGSRASRAAMHSVVPLFVLCGDVAKMLGYPAGLSQRAERRAMARSASVRNDAR